MSSPVASAARTGPLSGPERNRLRPEDRAVHDWYRFVLSFPSHLVRDYLDAFGVDSTQRVLDPFCGTGTTLVECKKLGIPSVGIERNPMAGFASRTKLDWSADPGALVSHAKEIAGPVLDRLRREGIDDFGPVPLFPAENPPIAELRTLPPERLSLLLKNSISPLPLHKALLLLDALEEHRDDTFYAHERLAFASALVSNIGNLHFGRRSVSGRFGRTPRSLVHGWIASGRWRTTLRPCGNPPGPKPPSTSRTRAGPRSSWNPHPLMPSLRRRRTPTRRTTRERHGSRACCSASFETSRISEA